MFSLRHHPAANGYALPFELVAPSILRHRRRRSTVSDITRTRATAKETIATIKPRNHEEN